MWVAATGTVVMHKVRLIAVFVRCSAAQRVSAISTLYAAAVIGEILLGTTLWDLELCVCVRVRVYACVSLLCSILPTVTDLDHLLLLLYVANDVLQNGRRRGAEVFHELFKEPLKEVFKLVRWV